MAAAETTNQGANMQQKLPFLAFSLDEVTLKAVAKSVKSVGWADAKVKRCDMADALRILSSIPTPNVLLIDLSLSDDPLKDVETMAEVCDPGTRVLTLGSVNDVALFRQLMELGVEDYLLKPVNSDALAAIFKRLEEEKIGDAPQPETTSDGQLITVTGVRGGVGASTVAVNTAWMLAHERGLRVALVDLDLHFGTASLALDLEPGRGFREALENPNRIDGLFIERAMARHSDKLSVLAAEESLATPLNVDPEAVGLLLEKLRQSFDCVVVDIPRSSLPNQSALLSAASDIIVVTDLSLAGMRDSLRVTRFLKDTIKETTVRLVANKSGGSKNGELSVGDFEKSVGCPLCVEIPFDAKSLVESANSGKVLAEVAKSAKPTNALRALSRLVDARKQTDGDTPSMWSKLFKKG